MKQIRLRRQNPPLTIGSTSRLKRRRGNTTERTEANKRTAIAYAAHRAMLDIFGEDKDWLDGQMRKNGYDPNDDTKNVTKPQGIGNVAAAAVIEYRHHDGANQLGDEEGSNGKPYSDYTFYRPVNSQADNIAGLELGRKVANYIYPKIESYFNGTAGKSSDIKMTAAR